MDWDEYFVPILMNVAKKSQDQTSKYGAVVVSPGERILSTGYNGIPSGVDYKPKYHSRPDKYMYFVHAEQNAIYGAALNGIALRDCTMYVIRPPCAECAKAIIQSGIRTVIWVEPNEAVDTALLNLETWRSSLQAAAHMLGEAGVALRRATCAPVS